MPKLSLPKMAFCLTCSQSQPGLVMTELDRPHYQCLNFSSAFSAYRLQQSDRIFDICDG
jgi:hypothetical protein